jgi:hypothetical protein
MELGTQGRLRIHRYSDSKFKPDCWAGFTEEAWTQWWNLRTQTDCIGLCEVSVNEINLDKFWMCGRK